MFENLTWATLIGYPEADRGRWGDGGVPLDVLETEVEDWIAGVEAGRGTEAPRPTASH